MLLVELLKVFVYSHPSLPLPDSSLLNGQRQVAETLGEPVRIAGGNAPAPPLN